MQGIVLLSQVIYPKAYAFDDYDSMGRLGMKTSTVILLE